MAEAIVFPGANHTFGAPPGREDAITPLPVFVNGKAVVSGWRLSEDELATVNRTGMVFVMLISGNVQFPMFLGDEDSVRRMVADTGQVWPTADRICFNPQCNSAGTHFPVIIYGPEGRVPGEPLPYSIEVPLAVCMACQPTFRPQTYVTEQAREHIGTAMASEGKGPPDFSTMHVTWKPLSDPVWHELKDAREARFWF